MNMESYIDQVKSIVDNLIDKKLKNEYFQNKNPENLKNIERAFEEAFKGYDDWTFYPSERMQSERGFNPNCPHICLIQMEKNNKHFNVHVKCHPYGPQGLELIISHEQRDFYENPGKKFSYMELKEDPEPLRSYLNLALIQAKDYCKK